MIKLPDKKGSFSTSQASDLFGDIVATRNVDFDESGYLKLARKPMVLYSDLDDTSFGQVLAIVPDATDYLIVTDENCFTLTTSGSALTFAELTTTGAPTTGGYTDAVSFAGRRYVSGTTNVPYWDGSAWQTGITGLSNASSNSIYRALCVFENKNRLAVATTANTVTLYNTSHSADTDVLTIPSDYKIMWMRWRQNNLYIGTRNLTGAKAKLFVWNGAGTSAQNGWPVNAAWMFSGCDFGSSITTLTSAGQLLRFNGGGFDPLANFPIYYTNLEWFDNNNTYTGKCHQRGMVVDGDIIYMNVDGMVETGATQPPGKYLVNQPSGIWVYDPSVGLYHKTGFANTKYARISVSSLSSNTLTMASAHQAETGDACLLSAVGSLTGVSANQVYYVIKESATQIQLALSPQDAMEGEEVALGGSAGVATIDFDTYNSNGSTFTDNTPGVICTFDNGTKPNTFYASQIFFTATVNNNTGTEIETFQSLGMGRNTGYIVSSKKTTDFSVKNTYGNILGRASNIIRDTDKVVVKYRTKRTRGLPTPARFTDNGKAEWANGKTFAVDSRYKSFHQVEVGDEVEIIDGAGSGRTAHIESLDYSTPSYSYVVTLDETLEGISTGDEGEVIVDNWTKLPAITNETEGIEDEYFATDVSLSAPSVQLKTELRGYDVKLECIHASSKTHEKLT